MFINADKFRPNNETDPKFSKKLSEARKKNIQIIPVRISFDGEMLYYHGKIGLADF